MRSASAIISTRASNSFEEAKLLLDRMFLRDVFLPVNGVVNGVAAEYYFHSLLAQHYIKRKL